MPMSAPRPCSYPGCGVLVRDGSSRCPKHQHVERREADARRGTAQERGYTAAWQRARAGFLRKHPLCVVCDAVDQVTAATVVDHIKPHRMREAVESRDAQAIERARQLFWDRQNWQSLCKTHHDIKTATEDGGFGRR